MSNVTKNNFNISGRVVFVGMPQVIKDNFEKRVLVMEIYINDRYKTEVPFEFANENMKHLDGINAGDWVNIDYCLSGWSYIAKGGNNKGKREWNTVLRAYSCVKQ